MCLDCECENLSKTCDQRTMTIDGITVTYDPGEHEICNDCNCYIISCDQLSIGEKLLAKELMIQRPTSSVSVNYVRKVCGLNIETMAKKTGFDPALIKKFESGEIEVTSEYYKRLSYVVCDELKIAFQDGEKTWTN